MDDDNDWKPDVRRLFFCFIVQALIDSEVDSPPENRFPPQPCYYYYQLYNKPQPHFPSAVKFAVKTKEMENLEMVLWLKVRIVERTESDVVVENSPRQHAHELTLRASARCK